MGPIKKLMKKLMSVASPHMRELGMEFLDLKDGVAVARIPYKHELVGDPVTGVLHGGVVTTLLDSTGGAAVFSRLKVPAPIATLDLRIDYLRGSTPNEPLYSRVECYKITRHVGFTRGIAHNGDESDPVASMSGTFMLNTTAVRAPGKGGSR